ncbi:MAG: flavodoxin, partial [Butyrivibrio sp.]|nr:flavodoxin [Butyrivibrio sp.]
MSKFVVIYASETGNTRTVAQEIFSAIRSEDKEIVDIRSFNGRLDADVYFIGYWVNHLTCSIEIMDLLSSLHGKHVALFATCGL